MLTDLVSAFETLDGEDTSPDIYCEANDLLSSITLELDPVSKQLETNTKVLQFLFTSIDNLPSQLNKHTCISDLASTPLQSLKGLINPRRACAARVTVLGLSFCLSVCLSVCPPRYSGSTRN